MSSSLTAQLPSALPPCFIHHPRPFLNSGETESSQGAKLQPTPVCTVHQALSSCFLPLCLAICLPPQFLHLGLPALRISVYPSPLQRMLSFHFAESSLIHFLNLSSKVSSRTSFSIPRVSLYVLAVWLHRTSNSSCELTIYSFSFKTKSLLHGMHSSMGKQLFMCYYIMLILTL